MADYFTHGVFHGKFPRDKLSAVDLAVADAFGLYSCEHEEAVTFTVEGGWQEEVYGEDVVFQEDQDLDARSKELNDLVGDDEKIGIEDFLRHICRKTELPHFTIELAFTCSKMRTDGFGGSGFVVTPDAVYSQATHEWIHAKLEALGLEPDAGSSQTILSPTKPSRSIARSYAKLHDGLSDMIEGGRLSEADIPDDYRWLVDSLAYLGNSPEDPANV